MADLIKHRLAVDNFAHDFAADLDTSESLVTSPAPSVNVMRRTGSVYEDVSDEFGDPSGTIIGTVVAYQLEAAGSGQQDGGEYRIRIEVETSEGRHLVGLVSSSTGYRLPSLQVTEDGDASAP